MQYAFDALGRMTTASENGTFLLATYIYDPLSRRTSLVYGNGATKGYTYTTQGDLLTLASTLSGASNIYTNTFTKAHQLKTEAVSNTAWQHVPAVFQTAAYSAANIWELYPGMGSTRIQTLQKRTRAFRPRAGALMEVGMTIRVGVVWDSRQGVT